MDVTDANELLEDIGRAFAEQYPKNRKKAWRELMFALVSNIATLSTVDRDRIENLRALIAMAREIDEKMGADETNAGNAKGEPLDNLKHWVAEN